MPGQLRQLTQLLSLLDSWTAETAEKLPPSLVYIASRGKLTVGYGPGPKQLNNLLKMSLDVLLQAAEFLERRDRGNNQINFYHLCNLYIV